MAAVHPGVNRGLHERYEDSDEDVALSDPSEQGDSEEDRSDDDFEYSDPSGTAQDAQSPDTFRSADETFDERHDEESAAVFAAFKKRQAEMPAEVRETHASSGLSQAQEQALRQLNLLQNGSDHPDRSVLDGYTEDNLRTRIGYLLMEKVANFTDADVEKLAGPLRPLVGASQGLQDPAVPRSPTQQEGDDKPSMNGHHEAHGSADVGAEGQSPIDIKGMLNRAAAFAQSDSTPEPSRPTAASAFSNAPPPPSTPGRDQNTQSSTPMEASTAAVGVPKPQSAMPSLPARPVPAVRPAGMPTLPARPPKPANGTGPSGAAPQSSSSAGPSLPPRKAKPEEQSGASGTRVPAGSAPAQTRQQGAASSTPQGNGVPNGTPSSASSTTGNGPTQGAPVSSARAVGNVSSGGAGGNSSGGGPADDDNSEAAEVRRNVMKLHVLLLRIALRLGENPRTSIVQQVVYRLDLAESIRVPNRSGPRRNPFEAAMAEAERQETQHGPPEELPFTATILCIGIAGTGKTATIHNLLDRPAPSNFAEGTKKVQLLDGTINGIRVRFIDTPGLVPAASAVGHNAKILSQIKKAHKKYKPDNVLYFDRMDTVRRDQGDIPVLRAITNSVGAAMWFNCILVLTHANEAPPDSSNGPLQYETYANQRTHALQQTIRYAAGDQRLLNPTASAENHVDCRRNAAGDPLLPSGSPWKSKLLLLCLSSKVLADADTLLKISANSNTGPAARLQQMLRGQRLPPIPHLLSVMVQPKQPRKYPEEERDIMLEDEIASLPTEEERRREMRKRREFLKMKREEAKQEEGAQVAIPAPDPPLPPTFDADINSHRYRFLEAPGGWLARPFVEPTGLDHDDGIDGLSTERGIVLRRKGQHIGGIPVFAVAQMQKDKNQQMLNADVEASVYHNSRLVSTGALDVMTTQRDVIYTAKAETRVKLHKKDKASLGLTVARLVEEGGPPTKGPVAVGGKVENRLKLPKKAKLISTLGRMTCNTRMGRENATAGQAELRLRLSDDQRSQVVVGTSFMNFRNDMAIAGNLAAQFSPTAETQVASRCSLNSKQAGSLNLRVTSHDHPKLGFSLLIPIASAIVNRFRGKDVY
ncbi:g7162 [Coccomyxa viridis]|uniref:G7162 protein n=1 Tax=Coccomyxa viridis TaxID=1274662 RepID=A0ABP1FX50_9CHLO